MAARPRLFVASEKLHRESPLRLVGPEHHYLSRVLRLREGDEVLLLDGNAGVATTRIISASNEALELERLSVETIVPPAQAARGRAVTLYMGLLKGEKHDLVVQKATELGASRIVTVICQRSVPDLGHERAERRQQRWQRIARAAAQQCRRPDLPEVTAPLDFAAALPAPACGDSLRLWLYEGAAPPLRSLFLEHPPSQIALFIGPEGGLCREETAELQAAGFLPCSLGPRVLRAETAALSALAVVQAELDGFSG